MEINIRVPQENEAQELCNYINQVGGESDFLTFGKNEYTQTAEDIKKNIRNISTSNNSIMLVVEAENKIIGMASIKGSDKIRINHVGELGITIMKDYWNQGIARKVITNLLEWARENNILYKVNLKVREDNLKAIKLYNDFEFKQEGILLDDFRVNNTYYNHVLMGINV